MRPPKFQEVRGCLLLLQALRGEEEEVRGGGGLGVAEDDKNYEWLILPPKRETFPEWRPQREQPAETCLNQNVWNSCALREAGRPTSPSGEKKNCDKKEKKRVGLAKVGKGSYREDLGTSPLAHLLSLFVYLRIFEPLLPLRFNLQRCFPLSTSSHRVGAFQASSVGCTDLDVPTHRRTGSSPNRLHDAFDTSS